MGASEVEWFLTHLAVEGKVAASTQNQAKAALLFLYKEVLAIELPWLDNVEQAKAPKRLPVVLNRDEIQAILLRLSGTPHLIASMLYGTGMRIMECLRLRVQYFDFKRRQILIRDDKGAKDRVTVLPASLTPALQAHLSKVRELHETDLAQGYGAVNCPMHWRVNIQMQSGNGIGSMCFRLPDYPPIRVAARCAAITFRSRRYNAP